MEIILRHLKKIQQISYKPLSALMIVAILMISCDGSVDIEILTTEGNSVDGLFKSDTIRDGSPIPNVNVYLSLANSNGNPSEIEYSFRTDSLGVYKDLFVVPPMKKEDKFEAYLICKKAGFINDTIYFNHSSIDKRFAIINMTRIE